MAKIAKVKESNIDNTIISLEKKLEEIHKEIEKNRLPDILFTVREVAIMLKVNSNTVYNLINKGHLTALKLGNKKITKTELLRFLKENNGKDFTDLDNVKKLQVIQ